MNSNKRKQDDRQSKVVDVHDGNVIIIGDTPTRNDYLVSYIKQIIDRDAHRKVFLLSTSKDKVSDYANAITESVPNCRISVFTGSETKLDIVQTTHQPILKKIKYTIKSSSDAWIDQIKNNDVLVTTAPLFQDIQSKGFVPIELLGAIIIDESNLCVGKHPYNKIITSYADLNKDQQPRILGLAAKSASIDATRWKTNMLCEEIIDQLQTITTFDETVEVSEINGIECFIHSLGGPNDVSHVLDKIYSSITIPNPRTIFLTHSSSLANKYYQLTLQQHSNLKCRCVINTKSKEALEKVPSEQVTQEFMDLSCNVVFCTDIFNMDLLKECDVLTFSDRNTYTRTITKLVDYTSRIIVMVDRDNKQDLKWSTNPSQKPNNNNALLDNHSPQVKTTRTKPSILYCTFNQFRDQAVNGKGLYLHVINSDDPQDPTRLGYLTHQELSLDQVPGQSLLNAKNKSIIMDSSMIFSELKLTNEQFNDLKMCHDMLLSICLNTCISQPLSTQAMNTVNKYYLYVPLDSTKTSIDYQNVSQILQLYHLGQPPSLPVKSIQQINEYVAIPKYGTDPKVYGSLGKNIYLVENERSDLNMHSRVYDSPQSSTFEEYYKKKHGLEMSSQSIILDVHPVRKSVNGLNVNQSQPIKPIIAQRICMEFCHFYPISHLFRSMVMMPCFMWSLEMNLIALELGHLLRRKLPKEIFVNDKNKDLNSLLLRALISKSSQLNENYEVLEFLGDDLFKLVTCWSLYQNKDLLSEGYMSQQKSRIVSNRHFSNVAVDIGLQEFMIADNAAQLNYSAPFLNSSDVNCVSVIFGEQKDSTSMAVSTCGHLILYEKNVADVVEALMGAMYVYGGLNACCHFVNYLNMRQDINVSLLLSNANVINHQDVWDYVPVDCGGLTASDVFCGVCLNHQYEFKNPDLLKYALTPGGILFERLEFIGDAVLDFISTILLMKSVGDDSTPGILTNLRATATCNYTFSIMSTRQSFHKYIPATQTNKIENFILTHGDAIEDCDWYPLGPSEEGPKILGDVFEAVAGAIFIDSGMDVNAVATAYSQWIDVVRSKLKPETFKNHPATKLMIMCQDEKCQQSTFEYQLQDPVKKAIFMVHGKQVGVGTGHNKKSARREASANALQLIEKDAVTFWKICNCSH
ncbi:endoribonuclease Dicer [Acrasis kona]|uniref:Endoribonuclease Dicer n=1 Tax=Acrasis kona TaxID=1008807 RepID=A0AAW2YYT1_9EUKA